MSDLTVTLEADGRVLRQLTVTDAGPASARPAPATYKNGRVKPMDKQDASYSQWDERLRRFDWSAGPAVGSFVGHSDDGVERLARRALTELSVSERIGMAI